MPEGGVRDLQPCAGLYTGKLPKACRLRSVFRLSEFLQHYHTLAPSCLPYILGVDSSQVLDVHVGMVVVAHFSKPRSKTSPASRTIHVQHKRGGTTTPSRALLSGGTTDGGPAQSRAIEVINSRPFDSRAAKTGHVVLPMIDDTC